MPDVVVYRDPRMCKEMEKIIKKSSGKVSIIGIDGTSERVDVKAFIRRRVDKLHNLITEYGKEVIHISDDEYSKGKIAEPLKNYPSYFSAYIVHGKPIQVRLIFAFFKNWTACVLICIFVEKNDSVDYDTIIKRIVNRRVNEWEEQLGYCSRRE